MNRITSGTEIQRRKYNQKLSQKDRSGRKCFGSGQQGRPLAGGDISVET